MEAIRHQPTTIYTGQYVRLKEAPSVPKPLLAGTMRRDLALAGRHAHIVSIFPSVASSNMGWPGWATESTLERSAEQTAWALAGAQLVGRNPAEVELSTQICFTAVAPDPEPLQQSLATYTGVDIGAQKDSTIFLTGSPAQVRGRLRRRREANSDGPVPSLPGDSGAGAGDRYLEAFAESVVRPLSGQ